jgi:flagellar hook-associated protein 2
MVSAINGVNRYFSNYAMSQINNTSLNPMANLIKISAASAIYSSKYQKSYDPRLSDYFNLLTKNTSLLKAATNYLQPNNSMGFKNKSVTAANDNTITGSATQKASIKDYTVNVKNLAEKQINIGNKLISNDKTSNIGINTFSINFGNGTSKNISFTLNNSDTNKTFLDKMANAINGSGTGIKVNVINDTKNGTSYLSLEGKTGAKSSYTLEDVTGNAVTNSNANNTTSSAKDAYFNVDGEEYTSEDNNVSLDNNKVLLNFNTAEAKDIKVSVGVDKGSAKESIITLVDNYNKLIDFSNEYSTEFMGANSLSKELGSIANSKKTALDSIGITVNNDNTLTIDEKKLDKSLGNDFSRVGNVITGQEGFSNKLDSKTNEILTNQYKYAKPIDINSNYMDINSYFSSSSKMPYVQNLSLGNIINTIV